MPIYVGTSGPDSIDGGAGDDTLQGNGGDDTLHGAAGNDSLAGGAGDDRLDGGTGADTLNGGAGSDTYFVDGNGDVLVEASGNGFDWVVASSSYSLTIGAAVEQLGYGPAPKIGDPINVLFDQTANVNVNFTGNEFAQELYGTGGSNVLVGGRNSDPLTGDSLFGNDGNDVLVVQNPLDSAVGGSGTDTIYVSVADLEAQGQAVATYDMGARGSSAEVLSAQNQQGTENLRLTGSGAAGETIVGNFGANTLSGGGGGDTLIGLDGNDTYVLTNANDVILQETGGNDTVTFAAGAGASFDFSTAAGGAMKDAAIENIQLGNGTVSVTGTSVGQTIAGTAANETLNGGGGVDTLIGGDGDDIYFVDVDGETVTEAAGGGFDTIGFNGTSGGYNLAEGVEVEQMVAASATTAAPGYNYAYNLDLNGAAAGTPGIYLVGNSGSQLIAGGGGNDILDGDRGSSANPNADTLAGGAGDDIYRVYDQTDVVSETQYSAATGIVYADAGGNDTVYTSADYSLAANIAPAGGGDFIENLIAADATSTVGLKLTGSGISNNIVGAAGKDTLDGGAGGTDTLQGLGGNDTYVLNAATDVVLENVGGGTDTINFAAGYAGGTTYTLAAGSEVEVINMGNGVTSVTGNEFAQTINGTGANETLAGGGGADTLMGGGGDDTYVVSSEGATIIDNLGANTVTYTGNTGGVNVGNQVAVTSINATGSGDVYLVGNNQVQTITGNAGDNILNGAGGLDAGGRGDTLAGGAGNDIYRVFNSNYSGTATPSGLGDAVQENLGAGTDTVYTSVSYVLGANVENLIAADQTFQTNLTLIGNGLDNAISGSAGNNVLYGGDGNDYLTGLGGADTFHFKETGVANADTIQDFFAAQGDKISLDAGAFSGFGTSIDGSEFQLGTVATGNQATILYDQATGRLFYDADGAASASDAVLFAQLSPGTALSADDFILTPAGTIPTPHA
jgi:Ca2+-binding RTX toxin-like protein